MTSAFRIRTQTRRPGAALNIVRYNRFIVLSAGMFVVGALLTLPLLREYWKLGFTLSGEIG